MSQISSILFSIALVLAVTIGPQTRAWSWGPALFFLGLSLVTTIPSLVHGKKHLTLPYLILFLVTAIWFIGRALGSPVGEFAKADLILAIATISSFIVVSSFTHHRASEATFLWVLAILVAASSLIIAKQVQDPSFAPIVSNRPAQLPSGFYGHYNEGANFLLGTSFFLAAFSLFGSHAKASRLVWGVVAVVGLVAVYFTRSRGAILGAGVGVIAFTFISLIIGKRANRRWFASAAILLPVLLIATAAFIYRGWESAQQVRFQSEIGTVMDGSVRLKLYGIALSCIQQHPFSGGGSRSFSWECNQFWDFRSHGPGTNRPEYVHNELLQAATDYGLVGFFLLVIIIVCVYMSAIIRSFDGNNDPISSADAWRAGAISSLAAMLVQSSFSFVFHLLPGVILLGICLAKALEPVSTARRTNKIASGLLAGVSIFCCLYLFPIAWKGSQLVHTLWSVYFKPSGSLDERVFHLERAISIWKESSLYTERARAIQRSASAEIEDSWFSKTSLAIKDYEKAIELHPYEAASRINLAKLLSLSGRNDEASIQYSLATRLQGGMEAGYQAHYQFAQHLVKEGLEFFKRNETDQALAAFQAASSQFEKIAEISPWVPNHPEGFTLKLAILQGLGASNEALGHINEALVNYDAASQIQGGSAAHYRAAILLGNLAKTAWSERRPSEALTRFQEARQRIDLANELPSGVTSESKMEYATFLDQSIQYLLEAKIEPLKKLSD